MKFSNGKKFTVMAIVMLVLAVWLVFFQDNQVAGFAALILSNLECEDG